jgi:methyl-accepting chemotaxis protein
MTFKQMWSTIGRGEMFRGIIKNRAKDGTPYYVDAVIAPILGENGKPMKYLGVRYDITASEIERQNARGICRSDRQFVCLRRVRPDGTMTSANGNFLRRDGLLRRRGVGRTTACSSTRSMPLAGVCQFWRDLATARRRTDLPPHHQGRPGGLDPGVYAPVKDEMGRVMKSREDRHRRHRRGGGRTHAARRGRAGPGQVTTAARRATWRSASRWRARAAPIAVLCEGVNELLETTSVIFADVVFARSARPEPAHPAT